MASLVSQAAKMQGQLSHIDFRRPTKAMANGLNGLAMSDSRSLVSGAIVPPDGSRLPAASSSGHVNHRNGMDQSGVHRLQGPWVVLSMIQIKEWQMRSMRYGDGWAYDSTRSHYKRAKPTETDAEDDRNADPSLPMGIYVKDL